MSGSGGGEVTQGPSQTTTQTADPWSAQQPYLKKGFAQAQNLFLDNQPTYFPGSTVVPFSNETQQALDLTKQRALNGSPITAAEKGQLTSTLNGDYLTGGSGFDGAIKAAMDKQLPSIDSQFELSGNYGSGLHQTARDQAFADAFAGQYGDERTRQMQAMMFAPSVAAGDYNDIAQLANVGGQKEALSQQQLQDQMARYDFGQNVQRQDLQNYMGLIQGNYGGDRVTTSPGQTFYNNQGAGILGGALGGASLAGKLGATVGGSGITGPLGLAGGSIFGGLLGGFL